jgi:hypothetical protein
VRARLVIALLALLTTPVAAQQAPAEYPGLETGKMWQLDVPPLDYWKARFNFSPSQEWLDQARLAALRYGSGCSASFVSPDGLVMTNHHCARACIESATKEGEDFLSKGFYAPKREDERHCRGLFLDQLQQISDVTTRVHEAIGAARPEEASKRRSETIGAIEKECQAAGSGTHCQVVTLYRGGQYKLYRFHRFSDVRLVMAPESQMAFFGGDSDNFTYPRHDIDMSFVRAYEASTPAATSAHYFKWSKAGAKEGDLLFVLGNPGSTGRLNTVAQLEYLRDVSYPAQLATLDRNIAAVERLSASDSTRAKALRNNYFSLQNSRKAIAGYQSGLLDPTLMQRKRAWEADFRKRVDADPRLKAKYGTAWAEVAKVQAEVGAIAVKRRYYSGTADQSRLLPIALLLVRYNPEIAKPDSVRLSPFREGSLRQTELGIVAPSGVDTTAEREFLIGWLTSMQKELGATDPLVKSALKGRTPAEAGAAMVRETELSTADGRRGLFESPAKLAASTDPFIELARIIDPVERAFSKQAAGLASREMAASEKIAQALLAVYGNSVAPDATFSLRISDGQVLRYPMNGTVAQPFTTFHGLWDRNIGFDGQAPWNLPKRWEDRKDKVAMATPYNAATTNDIIGGNSGSPVINKEQEVVGLIFDGNIEMLPNRFLYSERVARAVYLDSRAIVEALRSIYEAGPLADELTGSTAAVR